MSRKDCIVILGIIIIGIGVAYVINLTLSHGDLIETELPLNDWLNFWGGILWRYICCYSRLLSNSI